MTDSPLLRFIVDGGVPTMLGRGVAVKWFFKPEWCRQPLRVSVLWAKAPTDTFDVIGVVENDVMFVDHDRRVNVHTNDSWYALKIEHVETGETWYTNPAPPGSSLRKREWLIAREIVRREMVRLTKLKAGTRGWLLRRRISGQLCTYCVNPETGRSTRSDCPYCYGTTFVGGYYPPQEMWVDMQPDVQLRRLDPQRGAIADYQKVFRCLAFPLPNPNDYWVSAKSGICYLIKEQIVTTARIDEEPLILQLDVTVEHSNHVIYSYPLPERP